jgi:hypothetical protein
MRRYVVDVNLTAEQMQAFYAGVVGQVLAQDRYGVKVRFPAVCLREFVTHIGVHGRFALTVDAQNRLVGVERVH